MTGAGREIVVGVDAGGTKTVAWVAGRDAASGQPPLGEGFSGSGNAKAVGFKTASANVLQAVQAALISAGIDSRSVVSACLSIAGAGRSAEQERWHSWATGCGLADTVVVTGDAEPILSAAFPDEVGIALICGTGSLAWGRGEDGRTARAGGWGYLFGDEGSGYAISIDGLRAAAQAADGLKPATELLPKMLRFFDASEPGDLIARLYSDSMTRQQIAAAAAVVFELAGADEAARQIIQTAATDLAAMLSTLMKKLNFDPENVRLALAGGVLVNQSGFRTQLMQNVNVASAQVRVVEAPVAGAVAIARKRCG